MFEHPVPLGTIVHHRTSNRNGQIVHARLHQLDKGKQRFFYVIRYSDEPLSQEELTKVYKWREIDDHALNHYFDRVVPMPEWWINLYIVGDRGDLTLHSDATSARNAARLGGPNRTYAYTVHHTPEGKILKLRLDRDTEAEEVAAGIDTDSAA